MQPELPKKEGFDVITLRSGAVLNPLLTPSSQTTRPPAFREDEEKDEEKEDEKIEVTYDPSIVFDYSKPALFPSKLAPHPKNKKEEVNKDLELFRRDAVNIPLLEAI